MNPVRKSILAFAFHIFSWIGCCSAATTPDINSVTVKAVAMIPAIGLVDYPAPLPDPVIPSNLPEASNGENLKLWIYDPRSRTTTLGSPGIFIKKVSPAEPQTFVKAASDGSLLLKVTAGDYSFDVVEPASLAGTMVRLTYKASVSAAGVVSMAGKTADSRGYFAVTVTIVNVLAQQRLNSLYALANESALTFQPTSSCQLLDRITPNRNIGVTLSAGFPRVRTRLPSHGHIRALIVPMDFAEIPAKTTTEAAFSGLAQEVRDFYFKQSYGRLAFDFEILSDWVRLPFAASKYSMGSTVGAGDPNGYMKEIVALTQEKIDYSQYDAVYFLLPKETPLSVFGWGPAITSPIATNTGYITNGAIGGGDMYLTQNGINAARNWMAHETGHAFGLYDEDMDHKSQTLGYWSLMAQSWGTYAIEHNGWDRYLLGWLTDTQVSCIPVNQLTVAGVSVKLDPLVRQNNGTKAVMVPLSDSRILVMESRKNEGYDNIQSGREGVLVYTVDTGIGHLKGGYQTQRRTGSTDRNFLDAALKAGDSITVDKVVVQVADVGPSGDTVVIKALPDSANPALSVRLGGNGAGRVTSNTAAISCSTGTCSSTFPAGTLVTLTATANAGSVFSGWSGSCSGNASCVVSMTATRDVEATFAIELPRTITGVSLRTADNKAANSSASFFIGLSLDGNKSFVTAAGSTADMGIAGYINPDPAHLGQKADLVVVARVNGVYFMKAPDGNFIPWNGAVPSLVKFATGVTMVSNLEVPIFAGKIRLVGELFLFLGYVSQDGTLHYSPTPQRLLFTP